MIGPVGGGADRFSERGGGPIGASSPKYIGDGGASMGPIAKR